MPLDVFLITSTQGNRNVSVWVCVCVCVCARVCMCVLGYHWRVGHTPNKYTSTTLVIKDFIEAFSNSGTPSHADRRSYRQHIRLDSRPHWPDSSRALDKSADRANKFHTALAARTWGGGWRCAFCGQRWLQHRHRGKRLPNGERDFVKQLWCSSTPPPPP